MSDQLRSTALTTRHEAAGARLGPFAGWSMPIRFEGTLAEHAAVRESVGIFDVSHLGTVFVEGPGAEAVVAATFTNDPTRLDDGTSQYTLCCDASGGIVDDLIVYRRGPERFLAIPNAANTEAVIGALRAVAVGRDVGVRDESGAFAILAVQGPRALEVVDAVLASDANGPDRASTTPHLGVVDIDVAGSRGVLARTGYTGERGVEVLAPGDVAGELWDRIVAAGAVPCGLGARDTLRLEVGYPLHGNELTRETNPYEARLGWAVRLDREPFTGSVALRTLKERGPARRLWGLLVEGARPARSGMDVLAEDRVVGRVTSGTSSPTLGRPIALAYLDEPREAGERVDVDIRGRRTTAVVVRPPFLERDPKH